MYVSHAHKQIDSKKLIVLWQIYPSVKQRREAIIKVIFMKYRKFPKNSDTQQIAVITLKFDQSGFTMG